MYLCNTHCCNDQQQLTWSQEYTPHVYDAACLCTVQTTQSSTACTHSCAVFSRFMSCLIFACKIQMKQLPGDTQSQTHTHCPSPEGAVKAVSHTHTHTLSVGRQGSREDSRVARCPAARRVVCRRAPPRSSLGSDRFSQLLSLIFSIHHQIGSSFTRSITDSPSSSSLCLLVCVYFMNFPGCPAASYFRLHTVTLEPRQ